MSSFSGSACLLVILGFVFASGSPLQYISDSLKQNHKYIAEVLELAKPEVGSNPLFSSVIRSINTSCQRKDEIQLMNVTLDIYMRIFSSILQHHHNQHHDKTGSLLDKLSETERTQVTSALRELRQKMETLKGKLSPLNHEREDVISKLNKIEVDDPDVQRKALAEFKEIFQAASVIGTRRCGHAHSSAK